MRHRDDRYEWEDDDRAAWGDDAPAARPRGGVIRRMVSFLKLALFLGPVAFFAYGQLADCRGGPAAAGWLGMLGAGACARGEILGGAASMPENLAILKRLID